MVAEAAKKSILDEVSETLERAREELGAASCTFYVRDPFWPDELRLITMPGVRLKEPMHGFSFPPHSKRVLVEGQKEIFESASGRRGHQLREDSAAPLEGIPEDRRRLFGDFIMREGVGASARLWHVVEDADGKEHIEAVLFVNYEEPTEFDDELKARIRGLLNRLVGNLPQVGDELRASEMGGLVQAIKIFPPTYAHSAARPSERNQPLDSYLRSLLELAVAALGLDPLRTFGTVHLYDRRAKTLNLTAHYGEIKDLQEAAKPLSVPDGHGIISWVAIRRKALLVRDMGTSEFRHIHIAINEGVQSEVAIPIFDGEDLLGVLNLESLDARAFQQTCVRSLWFAVNRAAEAVRLSQQANISKRLSELIGGLFELCADAVGGKRARVFSLDRLARLAADELQAARCGIWRYDDQDFEFKLSGISPLDFSPKPPRPGGFSSIVQDSKLAVWVDISEGKGKPRFWKDRGKGTEGGWVEPSSDLKFPELINPSVEPGVKSLLGLPIKVGDQRTGIAWLEYENSPETYTESELMKLASGFADYAGLVIEFSQVDLVEEKDVRAIGDQLTEQLLAPGRLRLEGFDDIEVFVKSQNYGQSRIGGDFFLARVIDEQTAGVLFGDAEGHGVRGALNMLPMLSVFESFWKESRSVTHIMDKIMSASKQLGVRGTAVYCVFSVIGDELWLSVTSAGHGMKKGAPLVYFPKDGGAEPFPAKNSPARGSMLGVPFIQQPLAEARMKLSGGDVIIIYTDGLDLEFREMLGFGAHTEKPPAHIAESVFQAALDKRGGAPFDDDATVMVVTVKEHAADAPGALK